MKTKKKKQQLSSTDINRIKRLVYGIDKLWLKYYKVDAIDVSVDETVQSLLLESSLKLNRILMVAAELSRKK